MKRALKARAGPLMGIAVVFLAVLAAYWPAIGAGFVWDDDAHVTKAALRPVGGLWRIWSELGATQQYYPVLHSAFWIEHRLWGDWALGYHLLNVLLHGAAACLFALVLRRLWTCAAIPSGASVSPVGADLRGPSPTGGVQHKQTFLAARCEVTSSPVSTPPKGGVQWLAACLFALHPINVESVAWVSEQKNTLSAVFYLGAALAYLGFADAPGREAKRLPGGVGGRNKGLVGKGAGAGFERRRLSLYALGSALFLLAVLTKSITATLPAALGVALWWRRGRLVRRDVLPLVPWLAVGAGAGLFTAWVERRYIGAQGPEFDLNFLQRFAVAGRALWFYLGKLLWPSGFVFVYPRWDMNAQSVRMFLFPLGALGLLGAAWLLYRLRPSFRGPLAAALFFGGSLLPVLGFLNVYPFRFSYVADHFQYIASLGVFALLAGGADALWRRLAAPARPVLAAASVGVLAILGVLTWRLCHDYRDAETLYRATLARNPGAWLAEINLGSVLMEKGRLVEAESHYRAAEREEPDYHATHFDLGKLLVQEGRAPEAIPELNEALRLSPGDSEARDNLAIALAETGRPSEAEAQFRQAIRLQPGNPKAYYNLGVALQNEGRLEEAARSYEEALRLRPDFPEAHRALDQLRALPGGTGPGELGR